MLDLNVGRIIFWKSNDRFIKAVEGNANNYNIPTVSSACEFTYINQDHRMLREVFLTKKTFCNSCMSANEQWAANQQITFIKNQFTRSSRNQKLHPYINFQSILDFNELMPDMWRYRQTRWTNFNGLGSPTRSSGLGLVRTSCTQSWLVHACNTRSWLVDELSTRFKYRPVRTLTRDTSRPSCLSNKKTNRMLCVDDSLHNFRINFYTLEQLTSLKNRAR